MDRLPANNSWSRPNQTDASSVSHPVSALAADARNTQFLMGSNEIASNSSVSGTFDELFAAHYERLVRALTVVAGDRESAADAVQEAFVKAHLRWRKLKDYDDPIGWVRRVAINQLRDEHRRTGRKQRALTRLAGRTQTTTAASEIDEFDRLLAQLPKQQRAATALYYVDGLSIAEISVALEIAEGSVKSHLHDARRRLRPVLEQETQRSNELPDSWERP